MLRSALIVDEMTCCLDSSDCIDCKGAFSSFLRCRHLKLVKINVLSYFPLEVNKAGFSCSETEGPYLLVWTSSILFYFIPEVFCISSDLG